LALRRASYLCPDPAFLSCFPPWLPIGPQHIFIVPRFWLASSLISFSDNLFQYAISYDELYFVNSKTVCYDDGGSKLLWNIGLQAYLPDYTVQTSRRQPYSAQYVRSRTVLLNNIMNACIWKKCRPKTDTVLLLLWLVTARKGNPKRPTSSKQGPQKHNTWAFTSVNYVQDNNTDTNLSQQPRDLERSNIKIANSIPVRGMLLIREIPCSHLGRRLRFVVVFLSHNSSFTYHHLVRHYIIWVTENASLNKLQVATHSVTSWFYLRLISLPLKLEQP
jgi:hypothetical protein